MEYVYANLLGKWTCLNDDESCKMGVHMVSPSQWWEENADIWAPLTRETANTLYQFPYVQVIYKGKGYRIGPSHIQIVTE